MSQPHVLEKRIFYQANGTEKVAQNAEVIGRKVDYTNVLKVPDELWPVVVVQALDGEQGRAGFGIIVGGRKKIFVHKQPLPLPNTQDAQVFSRELADIATEEAPSVYGYLLFNEPSAFGGSHSTTQTANHRMTSIALTDLAVQRL